MAFSLDSLRNGRIRWLLASCLATSVLLAARLGWGQDPGKPQPKPGPAAKGPAQQAPAAVDEPKLDEVGKDASAGALAVDKLQWPEPRRLELLRNQFKELPTVALAERERNAVLEMAKGLGSLDVNLIRTYVAANAADLTKRANIAAMLGDNPGARNERAMDEAAGRLLQPLLEPATSTNAVFRRDYVKALIDQANTLLQGHLLTRTFYMVVLSRGGADELIPVFIQQLRDPQQTYMVKLLAAVGLTNVAQNGRRPPDANTRAIPAANALADFLRVAPPDAPWPVICRCLEALAAMRQSTENPVNGKAELADVAFDLLSRDDAEPQIRVWAGWALSRVQYPQSVRGLNFDLVASLLADTAADLGDRAAQIPLKGSNVSRNQRLVAKIAEALLRILEAFTGSSDIRGSGLETLSRGSTAVRGFEQRVRAVASDCMQLSLAAGNQIEPARKTLAEAVSQLRAYIDQNPPKSRAFYNGGPELAAPAPAAGAALPAAAAAAGPAGGH
jgi:hypothetical protein